MRNLADEEMGLGGSLTVVAAILSTVYACSLPEIPLWVGTQMKVVGPDRALRSDLRWILEIGIHLP